MCSSDLALLGDLVLDTPLPTIAARFHKGLAAAIVAMVDKLAVAAGDSSDSRQALRHVVLTGGVFQNKLLQERVSALLGAAGYSVLTHHRVPCNDGGLALGQAAVAAARAISP